ncbi:UNVERIFIED_CONTAM: hypothetical protein Sradi_1600100 [Sesamum radiatum]|uniref:MULE transposase domain-containing protein n=1 Tax=Sesamum radiatum TaxID=300843 RepID=A0AAW2UAR2_SESRA
MPANHENDDEVSIDIMMDVLEIPADSIDVPTGNWGHFYDSNTGELALGMVFKSKDHLKASVQDFRSDMQDENTEWSKAIQNCGRQTGVAYVELCVLGFQTMYTGVSLLSKCYKCRRNHLYTRYKHKLLVAVTLDANNQVLPLAFALVDEETLASWTWFLQMLARHFLPNEDDRVCLISDRHPGLINAINYVPAFKFPRGVHRFCLRHVCSNFNNKYKNVQLKDLCWRAGAESSARNLTE